MPLILIQLAIAIVFLVLSAVLMPKPKGPKPSAVRDMENPTAEGGRPIPVLFGSMTVKGANVLHYTDQSTRTAKASPNPASGDSGNAPPMGGSGYGNDER